MAAAALTPRVRLLVVCDEAVPSDTQAGIYDLQGVRQYHRAQDLFGASLNVFLLLSSARPGTYPGSIVLTNDEPDSDPLKIDFVAMFHEANELLSMHIDLGEWPILAPGRYRFEVWFSAGKSGRAQKGECPFFILSPEE